MRKQISVFTIIGKRLVLQYCGIVPTFSSQHPTSGRWQIGAMTRQVRFKNKMGGNGVQQLEHSPHPVAAKFSKLTKLKD
jgi:hypothetical protein